MRMIINSTSVYLSTGQIISSFNNGNRCVGECAILKSSFPLFCPIMILAIYRIVVPPTPTFSLSGCLARSSSWEIHTPPPALPLPFYLIIVVFYIYALVSLKLTTDPPLTTKAKKYPCSRTFLQTIDRSFRLFKHVYMSLSKKEPTKFNTKSSPGRCEDRNQMHGSHPEL